MVNETHTAWVLVSSALVLMMIPGLAFFYGGLVRRKNVAGTIMQVVVTMGIVGVIWVFWARLGTAAHGSPTPGEDGPCAARAE